MKWKKARRFLAVFATVILVFSVVTVGMSTLMSGENDTVINTVAGEENSEEAFFEVEIVDYDEEVREGETLTLEYRVDNTGEAEDTQTIRFYRGIARLDRSDPITLDVGEEYEGEFTWTPLEPREYNLRVESSDDQDEVTVTVTAVNELTINAEEGGTTDPEPGVYTYDSGEEETVEAIPDEGYEFVEWTGDVTGTDTTITVTMDTDKEITAVFQEEPDPAYFEVEITNYDDEVEEDETVTVDFTVENTGDLEDTQDIVFSVDGSEDDSMEVTLEAGEDYSGSFTWEAEEEGDYDLEVSSEDTSDSVTVTVEEEEPEIPGFTLALLVLGAVIAVAIYYRKEQ